MLAALQCAAYALCKFVTTERFVLIESGADGAVITYEEYL
jgi:hypothetical protein